MLQQRALSRDKILFRILKNKCPNGNSICVKLNNNVKNIVALSEDELCEIWHHMKIMLLETQKIFIKTLEDQAKPTEEYNVMVKMIRAITAIALETILQRAFIPNVLLQNLMLLHSYILPNINNKQVKNEISNLLENWWKLNMTWKEKMIKNVVNYLIQGCKSSLQHVKRLYDVRSAITLLKSTEDIQKLLRLVRENTVMSFEAGRLLILYLFTLGEQYILGIHNNMKVVLQDVKHSYIASYANLYVSAWSAATEKLKKFIAENCIHNIIFHCFRAHRNSKGLGKLGKNLFLFVAAIHENKDPAVRVMIQNQCKTLLWKYLKARGSYVRCNAVEILFMTSTPHYACVAKERNKFHLQKFYKTVNDLLNDPNHEVCNITMTGVLRLMEKHWNSVPTNIVRSWLDTLLYYTRNVGNAQIRANVFIGLRKILIKNRSHRILKDFLPNFAKSIYDEDNTVVEALIKLLWHVHNNLGIPFWNIVPLSYVLDQLEVHIFLFIRNYSRATIYVDSRKYFQKTRDTLLLQELIKLLWLRICLNGTDNDKIMEEIIYIGLYNVMAIRRFCLHSKSVINSDIFAQLIECLLSEIKEKLDCLPLTEVSKKRCSKKIKLNNKESTGNNDDLNIEKVEDLDSYKDIQICIDVIAMLLVANTNNLSVDKYNEEERNIMQSIANVLPELSTRFKDTPVNESIIFLFSIMPSKYFLDKVEVMEILEQQLYSSNSSDDVLFSLIHVYLKWNEGQKIFLTLTKLISDSLNMNTSNVQDFCNSSNVFRINVEGLELSLRILKHLLHVEYQSVLMNKYHQDVLKFWESLHVWRTFIESSIDNECNMRKLISKDLVVRFYKEYISLILLLNKSNEFNASTRFSEILFWVKKSIVPCIPHEDIDTEDRVICTDLIKCTLDTLKLLVQECDSSPKLCCDIVLLYRCCLFPVGGVVFLKSAFDMIQKLLDFSNMAYRNNEHNLLDIVVPNFVCIVMVTLINYNEDILVKYTDNLKVLHDLTKKYFSIVKNTYNCQRMCSTYITCLFNTAIGSVSKEMTRVLQNMFVTKENILITRLPYLARKILKIILHAKKYQTISVQVLTENITSYTKIDSFSALVIIYKMIQRIQNKTITDKLKDTTLKFKMHNQELSYNTCFEKCIQNAITIVINAIL
ncbi:condensin-2 complex subunit G2 isoform X2 [Augochlora pura]